MPFASQPELSGSCKGTNHADGIVGAIPVALQGLQMDDGYCMIAVPKHESHKVSAVVRRKYTVDSS